MSNFLEAGHWLGTVVSAVGLVVSYRACRLHRNVGYCLFVGYFFVTMLLHPYNWVVAKMWTSPPSPVTQNDEAYRKEVVALTQKYYPSGTKVAPGPVTIPLPVGQAVLVAAVWLVSKRDSGKA